MKIFISIKKKWLQHRVNKYTLKYEKALSKSTYYSTLAEKHGNVKLTLAFYRAFDRMPSSTTFNDYVLKASHYNDLSNLYLDRKRHLEEKLKSLT